MKRSNLNENTLSPNPYIDTSIKCALIGANETNLVLDGGQFIHRLWVGQPPATIFVLGEFLKKRPLFFLTFFLSNLVYKPTNSILGLTILLPLLAFLVGPTL
jgi:hypothetical protein